MAEKTPNLSSLDAIQTFRKSYNDINHAHDVVSVDSLVHERIYKVECTYIVLDNGSPEIETATYYGLGQNHTDKITAPQYPNGRGEISLISFYNKTPALLDGTYFIIYDSNGSVGIWFNVDGGSIPPATGADRDLEINILSSDNAITIANKVSIEVDLDAEFYASSFDSDCSIITSVSGDKPNATSGTSGVEISIQHGISSMNNTWFEISNINNTDNYYVWFNVDGAGVDPTPIAGTGIEVALINSDSDILIASKTAAAINAVSNLFIVSNNSSNIITSTYGRYGVTNGFSNGDSRFIFKNILQGEDCPVVSKLFITYGSNYEIASVERIVIGGVTN